MSSAPAYLEWPPAPIAELQARWLARNEGRPMLRWELEEWGGIEALAEWQAGRCAVCGSAVAPLVLDHDHLTGLVRGWLCPSCNRLEGTGREIPRFAAYRARPPAAVLGVEELYPSPYTTPAVPPASVEALQRWEATNDPARRRPTAS